MVSIQTTTQNCRVPLILWHPRSAHTWWVKYLGYWWGGGGRARLYYHGYCVSIPCFGPTLLVYSWPGGPVVFTTVECIHWFRQRNLVRVGVFGTVWCRCRQTWLWGGYWRKCTMQKCSLHHLTTARRLELYGWNLSLSNHIDGASSSWLPASNPAGISMERERKTHPLRRWKRTQSYYNRWMIIYRFFWF